MDPSPLVDMLGQKAGAGGGDDVGGVLGLHALEELHELPEAEVRRVQARGQHTASREAKRKEGVFLAIWSTGGSGVRTPSLTPPPIVFLCSHQIRPELS